ncbi:MAG: hypothetical protein O3A87_02195, partial [Verrucomicrobia bacterium]|nr:hypothetical protein [Verrucomicrobiota bacterium]
GRLDEIHLMPRGEITSFRHDGDEQSTEPQGLQGLFLLIAWESVMPGLFTLGGDDAANYTLAQPTGLTADINELESSRSLSGSSRSLSGK